MLSELARTKGELAAAQEPLSATSEVVQTVTSFSSQTQNGPPMGRPVLPQEDGLPTWPEHALGLMGCELAWQTKLLSTHLIARMGLNRLMRHAQVCLGEIPLRLKMRKAHSADVLELETHQRDATAANRALELLGREVISFEC